MFTFSRWYAFFWLYFRFVKHVSSSSPEALVVCHSKRPWPFKVVRSPFQNTTLFSLSLLFGLRCRGRGRRKYGYRTSLRRKRVLNAVLWLILISRSRIEREYTNEYSSKRIESLWFVSEHYSTCRVTFVILSFFWNSNCFRYYDLILTDHDLPSANKKTKPWVRILVQRDFV